MQSNGFTRSARRVAVGVLGTVALVLVLACNGLGGISRQDITKDLSAELQAMVVAEPDAVTKALLDAGFAPFAIKGALGSSSYATIYFAFEDSDATLSMGHGTVAEPWITRHLVDAPKDADGEDYRKFLDNRLTIIGDDRQDREETRPRGATAAHFMCQVEPPIASDALRKLPAAMAAQEVSTDFTHKIGGTTFTECLKG